ncbi:MAG TPA: thioredoxin domain-containing protein, partial [Gammaproteobacteria bacterium]|nr:thioredoxin domain-containing protein [Gammaproteobacteria bacterium]
MTNELARETSPYLLQHASNPVDWLPWGEKALQQSRAENKPILLSIGYSACHWCHVMAHESFEDPVTAELMNRLYISVKVDREERPDLDKIYQRAHQMLTQRTGGWPLTLFLMPEDQIPFFAGTYFPVQTQYNLPGFSDVLQHISDYYHQQQDELQKQNDSLMEAFASMQAAAPSDDLQLTAAPLDIARKQLESSMDWKHGGFGQAPKFPHPTNIERLLRHWFATQEQDDRALEMVNLTLQRMSLGGLQDQLGGGFCRYSVDDLWMIPHFEKMLYDNGPLLALYSEALTATGDELYRQTALATANWVMQDMQSPEGGYYSSIDADSEGEEGKFYSWQQAELHELLDKQEYQVAAMRYGFDRKANFEDSWYPHTFTDWQTLCKKTGLDIDQARLILKQASVKLFNARK